MKKSIALAVIFGAAASLSAHAYLYVNWSTPAGFTMNDGVTPILSGGQTGLVQLVFSPDATPGLAQVGGAADGDIILDQREISEASLGGGDTWGLFFSELYGPNPDMVGSVYIRMFQGGTSIGNVSAGDWYFTSALLTIEINPGPPNTAQDLVALAAGTGPGDMGTAILNQQVVPEPTTLALAALGVLGVVARRFRRS
ncbi:MAG: PEP-CTERM sorting domain-containing protein [Kiritimatiellae bacterium]|nr:PEP-CTERM sorting domain-containing protein [Kiritimatiellia bacterium]MCO5061094.1 PEP-CTERM sorting domain-containing protein [Kiritimatiellia bacterium]